MAEYLKKDKAIDIFIEGDGDDEFTAGYIFAVNEYREKIKAMAAEDVQPVRHGRWIWNSSPEFGNPYGSYVCSECDERQAYRENYCPNCGTRMDLKDGDTNE